MDIDIESQMGMSFAHFVAGAVAGTVEHCGMYPVDTLKVIQYILYKVKINIFCTCRRICKPIQEKISE